MQLLEEQGTLRHLRIANSLDPVTMNPPASTGTLLRALSPAALLYSAFIGDGSHTEIYYHVGVKLKLFGEDEASTSGPFKITYSRGQWNQDLFVPAAAACVSHHYGREYSVRLLKAKNKLEAMNLNDLYAIKHASG